MRILPRGRRKETLILFLSTCSVLGFIKLNSVMDGYQHTSLNFAGETKAVLLNKNYTAIVIQNSTKRIKTSVNVTSQSTTSKALLQLVTKSPHSETLKTTMLTPGSTEFTLNFSVSASLQYGHFRPQKGFLTIAIPSVKRERYNYIDKTIDSLLANSSPKDKETVTIVIMFNDDDTEWNNERALNVSVTYDEYIQSGHIQVITLPPQQYPDFQVMPTTYNDSVERLKWRSKQNIHYAFLFKYCHNISDFYMHLEDDVVAAKNYIQDIRKYKRIFMNNWFLIRFSNMGFIGIFFKSSNLLTISDFFLLFYAVQPCDFLMNIIAKIKLQEKEIRYRPSLFQHHGIISSLKNKKQLIVDRYFKGSKITRRKKFYNLNPPAEVDTTMVVYETYTADKAYLINDKYFWAVSPQKGQTYTVVLKEQQTLKALVIVGAYPTKKADYIQNGEVQISSSQHCSDWIKLGELTKGSFDSAKVKNPDIPVMLRNITCIQIEVTKSQNEWAIISELALKLDE
ncbi:alpha-1,3-mannosyl-glycoprotein 4-beta-N-acetylglucosaminyltransferase C-like [Mytilus trossulus]|uniref:alpha-1,3-mannosyl-glycoprotein 4-beta-N-acetylglucosaminyltransferase C-like n=1 Tax=Mytilus trossulus TaxID=6551 RepID=UPI003005FAC3